MRRPSAKSACCDLRKRGGAPSESLAERGWFGGRHRWPRRCVMAGKPRRRVKAGLDPKPWKTDPSLSTRPPFAEGNRMAQRHGAYGEIDPIARQLAAELLQDRPDLERFPEAVRA